MTAADDLRRLALVLGAVAASKHGREVALDRIWQA
jgi:hypothetical protein